MREMFKIVLYGSAAERKQMKEVLSQHLNKNKVRFEIIYETYDSSKFIKDSLFKDFNLYMLCQNSTISYMLKTYRNYELQTSHYVSGTVKFPLTYDELDKMPIKNHPLTCVCPYGTYLSRKGENIHKILHEEIEYIHRKKRKTFIHLNNGDTIETAKSLTQIRRELDRSYFFKCSNRYMINLFSINMLTARNAVQLKSGAVIPLSKGGFANYFKALVLSELGSKIWK